MFRGMATLESERVAFEAEKKAHNELYERQQQVSYKMDRIESMIIKF